MATGETLPADDTVVFSVRGTNMFVLLNLPENYLSQPKEAAEAALSAGITVSTEDIRLRLLLAVNTGPPCGMELCTNLLSTQYKSSGAELLQAEEKKRRSDILFSNGIEWAEASKRIRVRPSLYNQNARDKQLMEPFETFQIELAAAHLAYRPDGLYYAMMGLHRMASSRSKRKTHKQNLVFAKHYTGAQTEDECKACVAFLHAFRDTHLCTEQAIQNHPAMLAVFLRSVVDGVAAPATVKTPPALIQKLIPANIPTPETTTQKTDTPPTTAPAQQPMHAQQTASPQPVHVVIQHYAAKTLQRAHFIKDFCDTVGISVMMAPSEVAKLAFGAYVLRDIRHSMLYQKLLQHHFPCTYVRAKMSKRIAAYVETRPKLSLSCWKQMMHTFGAQTESKQTQDATAQTSYTTYYATRVPLPVYLTDADRTLLAFTSLQPNYKTLFKQVAQGVPAATRERLHHFHFNSVGTPNGHAVVQALLEKTFHAFLCQTQHH